jgi:hypothetical protein
VIHRCHQSLHIHVRLLIHRERPPFSSMGEPLRNALGMACSVSLVPPAGHVCCYSDPWDGGSVGGEKKKCEHFTVLIKLNMY